ncbi:MAG TPA: hypothetical protein ENJ44_01860 [Oceanospirillales bacterium]|nr:hypothetical protein [Oceanospirillales bacterium]
MCVKSIKFRIILFSLLAGMITQVNADVATCGTNIALSINHKEIDNKANHAQGSSKSEANKKHKHKASSSLLGNFKLLIPKKLR